MEHQLGGAAITRRPRLALLAALLVALVTVVGPAGPTSGAGAAQAQPATGLTYHTVAPCRVLDSRTLQQMPARAPYQFGWPMAGRCGVPVGPVRAVMANVIAVDTGGTGYVRASVFEDDGTGSGIGSPEVTVLNFSGGLVASNAVPLPVCGIDAPECDNRPYTDRADTTFRIAGTGIVETHLVIDIIGYFAEPGA